MCCWMTIRAGDDPLGGVLDDLQPKEELNGHSWGVAFARDGELTIERGVGQAPRGKLDTLDPEGDATAAIAHTRYATRGLVCTSNAHPFPIRDADGNVVAALAHNGTWYGAPEDDYHSDSWYMARDLERRYRGDPDAPFEAHVKATGDHTGETFVALHRSGVGYVYAGRFTITEGEEYVPEEPAFETADSYDPYDAPTLRESLERRWGAWRNPAPDAGREPTPEPDGGESTTSVARSSGGKVIPKGTVVRVEPDHDDAGA